MSTTGAALGHGLRTVTARPQLLLIDLLVKAVWTLTAAVCLLLALIGAASTLTIDPALAGALEGGVPLLSVTELGRALAQVFAGLLRALIAGGLLALVIWIPLEAFARAGLAPWGAGAFFGDARRHFPRFLLTGLLRRLILLAGVILIGAVTLGPLLTAPPGEWSQVWPDVRAGAFVGVLAAVLLALALSVAETFVRNLPLTPAALAACLPGTVAIVLATVGVEWAVLAAAAAAGLALAAATDSLAVGVLVLGALAGGWAGWHSYCLLVRYAAAAWIGARAKPPWELM